MKVLPPEDIRALPLPSIEQHRAFVEHLGDVHSWYKHLPLLTGGEFVVFLAPDAGEGYPSQHPRLQYGNTIAGYRRAFGYLDYMWSIDRSAFDRDGGHSVILPPEVLKQCCFVLYPYVSREFYWCVHEDAIASLRAGTPHPERMRILEWNAIAAAIDSEAESTRQIYLEQAETHIWEALHDREIDRIDRHLEQLYRWHGGTTMSEEY
jgi:hypothetical protein